MLLLVGTYKEELRVFICTKTVVPIHLLGQLMLVSILQLRHLGSDKDKGEVNK